MKCWTGAENGVRTESKLIVVVAGYAPSLINFREPLLRSMVAAGHRVIACAPEKDPAIERKLQDMGVDYRAIPMRRAGLTPGSDVVWLLRFHRLLRRCRPDVVFAYTAKPVIFGSLAARAAGVPAVASMITGLGYSLAGPRLLRQANRWLYRAALAGNDVVFFQNADDLQDFRSLGIVPADAERPRAIVTNGSGVDLDHYADDPLTAASAPESIVFLLIARLLRDKGIVEYVDAARRLKGRYPGARFQLVGFFDVNPAALTRQEVDAWVREGVIEFAGETTDVRPFLRNCDVYVLPSYREGTPRTVLEAMATGRPVITTDAPGCRETVAIPGDRPARSASGVLEGLNGFLVPVRNSAALAEAMERFIVAPDLIATMGRCGRDYAEQRYDVHRVNDVVLSGMNLARTTARPAPAAACS